MEIKLTKDQQEYISIFVAAGIPEKVMIRQLIDVGLLFYLKSPSNRKLIMEILKPK